MIILYSICGIYYPSKFLGILEVGCQLRPVYPKGFYSKGIFLAHLYSKSYKAYNADSSVAALYIFFR